MFLEHKALYNVRGPVDETLRVPLGQARVAREGAALTIAATQLAFHRSLEAADRLAADGIDVEVIDLRCLYPLDVETVLNSVAKTRRLLVAHEAPTMYGFGNELASTVNEQLWDVLAAPATRLGSARTPIPYAPVLEKEVLLSSEQIEAQVRGLVNNESRRAVRS